ncbi:MAG: hypothetical protein A2133_06955 [Actinobacteria bacterium RBG_16_64_13]|nr:MAG: hypothetical protein A2133_06955 [Actinobacteria bacterium RBG_16_64_13]
MTLTAVALTVGASIVAGCADPAPVVAGSRERLAPGITYSADLDGDRSFEKVLVDETAGTITIIDGDVVYRSRDKWRVVGAYLGDTDHNGVLEVVTLLDDEDGRHLGLFAYYGGEYRERLVTSELVPRPAALEVIKGDLILLTLEPAEGQAGIRTLLLRWNGFSFTNVETSPAE